MTTAASKPVILLTVHRRYHELSRAIERIGESVERGMFRREPDVWVVWARPEVGRLWFFQELLDAGRMTRLLTRPPLPGEEAGCPTTFPESHNLRLGLNHISRAYPAPENAYVIGQAADILPHPGAYRFIDDRVHLDGCRAVVFYWENGVAREGVWHTNFFCVSLDEDYWPPISSRDNNDVLERQWGKLLTERKLPRICKSHNSRNKKFVHEHRSEHEPPWPVYPQSGDSSLTLSITGYKPWWRRLMDSVRRRN